MSCVVIIPPPETKSSTYMYVSNLYVNGHVRLIRDIAEYYTSSPSHQAVVKLPAVEVYNLMEESNPCHAQGGRVMSSHVEVYRQIGVRLFFLHWQNG